MGMGDELVLVAMEHEDGTVDVWDAPKIRERIDGENPNLSNDPRRAEKRRVEDETAHGVLLRQIAGGRGAEFRVDDRRNPEPDA